MVGLTCNRAHQSDIGGGAAGAYNPVATDAWSEGVRLPVLKLVEAGKTREDVWKLLMLNTRTPHLQDGDLRAMLGSTRIGMERVAALVDELGVNNAMDYFTGVLDHADRSVRAEIAKLPDGVYEAEDRSDNDCFEIRDVIVRVKLTIKGENMTVDFTGTDEQILGFKNSSLGNTYSAIFTALASFLDPHLPHNEGAFRCVDVIAPEGTIINANEGAPTTMCTVFFAHEIIPRFGRHLCRPIRTVVAPDGPRTCSAFPSARKKAAIRTCFIMGRRQPVPAQSTGATDSTRLVMSAPLVKSDHAERGVYEQLYSGDVPSSGIPHGCRRQRQVPGCRAATTRSIS